MSHTSFAYKTHTKHGRQTHTPHTPSAYKTRTKHGHQSPVRDTHPIPLCLQDPHEAWSPVRDTHTPHSLCLQDPHEAWLSVRDTHTPYNHPVTSQRDRNTLHPLAHMKHGHQSATHTPHSLRTKSHTKPDQQSEKCTQLTFNAINVQ